jgi:lipopolysaccharide export system permease protein
MPIAVLIGTLYALVVPGSSFRAHRLAGLRPVFGGLLRGLFLVAGLFAVATFLIGEYVAPTAEREANQLRLKARGRMIGQDLRSGLWVKDERSFINVRVVLPDTRLRGIRIYEFDEEAKLRSLTEARRASTSRLIVGA